MTRTEPACAAIDTNRSQPNSEQPATQSQGQAGGSSWLPRRVSRNTRNPPSGLASHIEICAPYHSIVLPSPGIVVIVIERECEIQPVRRLKRGRTILQSNQVPLSPTAGMSPAVSSDPVRQFVAHIKNSSGPAAVICHRHAVSRHDVVSVDSTGLLIDPKFILQIEAEAKDNRRRWRRNAIFPRCPGLPASPKTAARRHQGSKYRCRPV